MPKPTRRRDWLLTPFSMAGMCRPRCSPISTKHQWDRARCSLRPRDARMKSPRKGTACTLMLTPHSAVRRKQITRAALISVCAMRRGVYFPLNRAVIHFRFRIWCAIISAVMAMPVHSWPASPTT